MTAENEAIKKLSEACERAGATMVVFSQGVQRAAAQLQQFANVYVVTGQLEVTFSDEDLLRRFRAADAVRAEELRALIDENSVEVLTKSVQRHDYWNVQGKRSRWK